MKILLITKDNRKTDDLRAEISRVGGRMTALADTKDVLSQLNDQPPDAVLVDLQNIGPEGDDWQLPRRIKKVDNFPVLAFLSEETLPSLDKSLEIDDFVLPPYNPQETIARIRRILWRSANLHSEALIKSGDLLINLESCEVTLSGRPIPLTFKEYELLRFLANHPGRVFTREGLLDEVWGFDYYGGDRTVDVHIRRLRSKIEDPAHSFIETVRNIGYRFKRET